MPLSPEQLTAVRRMAKIIYDQNLGTDEDRALIANLVTLECDDLANQYLEEMDYVVDATEKMKDLEVSQTGML